MYKQTGMLLLLALLVSVACGGAANGPFLAMQVDAGEASTCAQTPSGDVYCWGWNDYGQVGDGTTSNRDKPSHTLGSLSGSDVASGTQVACALNTNRTTTCWGFNRDGRVGDGTTRDRHAPVEVDWSKAAIEVTSNGVHVCALVQSDGDDDDNEAFCWGGNSRGQLGIGNKHRQNVPTKVEFKSWETPTSVSGGGQHTCAVTSMKRAACWGSNSDGQLGIVTTKDQTKPRIADGLNNVLQISAGIGKHTCGITTNGSAFCFGANDNGQLGDGTTKQSYTAVTVKGLTDAESISAGGSHSCAVSSKGAAYCWGSNHKGQLGVNGTSGYFDTPQMVTSLGHDVLQIDCGSRHTCAVLRNNELRCWGDNSRGQLGVGDSRNRRVPFPVEPGA